MSRISQVMKSRNRLDKVSKSKRNDAILSMRNESMYKAKLLDNLKIISLIFSDSSVKSINISIPDDKLSSFHKALHYEELSGYIISQREESEFNISRREINI